MSVSISSLLNQDHKYVYQVQATQGDRYANIVRIGKYKKIPITAIGENINIQNDNSADTYNAILVSYLDTEDEYHRNGFMRMVGYIVKKNNDIIASLDYVFYPREDLNLGGVLNAQVDGKFGVVFEHNQDTRLLRVYEEYTGREESLYLVSEVFQNVIETEDLA